MEQQEGRDFAQARRELYVSSYFLIGSFLATVALVVVKPIFVQHNVGVAFINGLALWILLFNVLVLTDLTAGIFAIRPRGRN